MIGTHPMAALGPLDYRYALDAAMTALAGAGAPAVRCNIPELAGEVRQRIPRWAEGGAAAVLWVEPLADNWRSELAALGRGLPAGAPLVIIASRPLARMLPERRGWGALPLGLRPGGVARLRRALPRAGFTLQATYGIHPAPAIGQSLLGCLAARLGRPDLADRLQFAARLRYCASGPLAMLSTVALLIARRNVGKLEGTQGTQGT